MQLRPCGHVILLVCAVACGGVLCAGDPPAAGVGFTTQPPTIDGGLDDACWRDVVALDDLQPALDSGKAGSARQPTRIRLLWDADYLYVSFACRDADVYSTGSIPHDGDLYKEDVCEVFLSALADGRQWFEIQVSPRNQTMDVLHLFTGDPSQVTPTGRLKAEAVARDRWALREWEATGLRTAAGELRENGVLVGWTVEAAIPAALLTKRLNGGALRPLNLYANFVRYDHPAAGNGNRSPQFASWSAVESGCPHISPSRFGTLRLLPPGHDPYSGK